MVAPCSNRLALAATLISISISRHHPIAEAFLPGVGTTLSALRSYPREPQRCRADRVVTAASASGDRPKVGGGGKPTASFKPGRVTVSVNPPDVIPSPSSPADQKKKSQQQPPPPQKNKKNDMFAAMNAISIPTLSLSPKAAKEETTTEDERRSTRWGVPPVKLPSKNPISAVTDSVSGSIKSVGRGVTGVKDALYDAADTAGSFVELTQQSIDNATGKNAKQGGVAGAAGDGNSKQQSSVVTPLRASGAMSSADSGGGGGDRVGGGIEGVMSVLKALGTGAVVVKDVFWGSIDVLSEAAEAAKKAPEVAKSLAEESKAALEGESGRVIGTI